MQVRRFITAVFFLSAGLARSQVLPTFTLFGDSADVKPLPRFEVGTTVGRSGAAFGEGILLQINFSNLGIYGFAEKSAVNGYQTNGGITANFGDRTVGLGVDYRVIQIRKWTIGPFGEFGYDGTKILASIQDPVYGTIPYRESDRNFLITVGLNFEYRPTRGITIFIKPGENLGNSFAAQTFGGFSINGGVKAAIPGIRTDVKSAVAKLFH